MLNAWGCNLIREARIRVKSAVQELCAPLRATHEMASCLSEGEARGEGP